HFLKRLGEERRQTFTLSPAALAALAGYAWPGNVRELENALEAAVALNRSGMILPEDLPAKVRGEPRNGDRLEELYRDLPPLEELKKRYAAHVLKVTGNSRVKAAEVLRVSRSTLYSLAGLSKPEGESNAD